MKKYFLLLASFLIGIFNAHFALASDNKLTIGITLQPYYSYVKAVVGDKATILPLVDAGFNPHNYQLQPNDLRRLKEMDVIVVNGIGHDDFALKVIKAANRSDLKVIEANKEVPLLPAMGQSVGQGAVNPHTFVGFIYHNPKGIYHCQRTVENRS